jgi:hypothetical protein
LRGFRRMQRIDMKLTGVESRNQFARRIDRAFHFIFSQFVT